MQLLRWIASDGQLRTDDQIVDEMVSTLGFSRRGIRIGKSHPKCHHWDAAARMIIRKVSSKSAEGDSVQETQSRYRDGDGGGS
jgi:NOL1/NOP2/fmu family ribosome biogenesis protein